MTLYVLSCMIGGAAMTRLYIKPNLDIPNSVIKRRKMANGELFVSIKSNEELQNGYKTNVNE